MVWWEWLGNVEYFPVITNRIFGCSFGVFLCAGGQYIFAYFLLQLFMCLPKGLFEVLLTSSRHAKNPPTRGGKNRKDYSVPHFEYLGKVKSLRQEVITPEPKTVVYLLHFELEFPDYPLPPHR